MRKQTKKVLSMVMSAALAITLGAGVNLTKSSAKADSLQWTGSVSVGTTWSSDKLEPKTDDGSTITLNGVDYNSLGVSMKVDLSAFDDPTVTVTATADDSLKEAKPFAVCNSDWSKDYAGNNKDGIAVNETQITGKLDKSVSDYLITAQGRTITKIVISDGDGSTTPSDTTTPGAITTPGAVETPAPTTPSVPTDADLVGTAQLDSQANGWCGNEDCTNVKADIKGAGTYVVSSTWEEVQEDPQAYCAMTIADLKDIASYITFSNVTVWVDGNVVDMPVIYGGDKDCRIQLWNTWGNDGVGAGFEVPASMPETFYEIKVQFTIGLRDTARDWDAESKDASLITVDTTQPNYEPANKPAEPTPVEPTPAPSTKNTVKALKAAKKTVSVKKGKKANVTVKVTANDNKKKTTDKVTATSGNKKVAKVVKTSVKAGKIVVSVKGVKKGTAKITVKAASKKAVVTVKVK